MDVFGDRMKEYELQEAGRRFLPLLPVIARIDGMNFSRFTRGFARPFDGRMSDLMIAATQFLVEWTGALLGYTQSDEIGLVFYSDDYKSRIFFDGRIANMTSVLASMATGFFVRSLPLYIQEKENSMAFFDCRVWQVPTLLEAANAILWRETDAIKNSVSMAARCYYSHDDLLDKGRADMLDLLMAKGVNWNDYPVFFKRRVFIQKRKVMRSFAIDEIEELPEKHQARTNPNLQVERAEIRVLDMPPFARVTNRVGVIFHGDAPIVPNQTILLNSQMN